MKPIKLTSQTNDIMYKTFFKIYYREKLKIASAIMLVLAVFLILTALYSYYTMKNNLAAIICLWLGAFFIVYPKMAYRKPFKAVKGRMVTSRFKFEEDKMSEKSSVDTCEYNYSDIKKIIETNDYFIFMYTDSNASVADKKLLSASEAEIMRGLFKAKGRYKFIK